MSDNLQFARGGCISLASAALANGTDAGTVKTVTNPVAFTIDGVFKSKAATDNIAFTVSDDAVYGQPTNGSFTGATGGSTRLYGMFIDAAGAVTFEAGPIVNTAELAAGTAPLHFPAPQRNKACLGMVRIAVTAGTTFIPGTTALGAAGVTTTYVNLSVIPAEPLRA
jgi:hypothetical protein